MLSSACSLQKSREEESLPAAYVIYLEHSF